MIDLTVHPLTPERWADFEKLFGPRGACGGCWCVFWKRIGKEFDLGKGEPNRLLQKSIVNGGTVPGILAYVDNEPVGWCAIEPRSQYPKLARSRILYPLDGEPVWSLTCFFVAKNHRCKGVSSALLRAAVDYVAAQGGKIVEGYPEELHSDSAPAAFIFTGVASAFEQAGFVEVARRSPNRPIFRHFVSR